MKKILFTLLLVLGISAAADAQVRFLDSSTDAVRKEAIAQDGSNDFWRRPRCIWP